MAPPYSTDEEDPSVMFPSPGMSMSQSPTPAQFLKDYVGGTPSVSTGGYSPDISSLLTPYDDAIKRSSQLEEGYGSERVSLYNHYKSLDSLSNGTMEGALGAFGLPLIAGLLAGGNLNDAIGGASAVSQDYFNNLEADEKEKKKLLAEQIGFKERQIADAHNFTQQLGIGKMSAQNTIDSNMLLGKIPGTDQYERLRTDNRADETAKLMDSLALYDAKQKAKTGGAGGGPAPSPLQDVFKFSAGTVGAPISHPEDIAKMSSKDISTGIYGLAPIQRDRSLDQTDRARTDRRSALAIDGYQLKNDLDPAAALPSPVIAQKAQVMRAWASVAENGMSALKANLEKAGSQITPEFEEANKPLLGQIRGALKEYFQLGGAITTPELKNTIGPLMPALFMDDAVSWKDFLSKESRGVNPANILGKSLDVLHTSTDTFLSSVGYARQAAPANAGPGGIDFSTAPPGMTLDQYREWKRTRGG
jgi:hypothetical protein